MRIEDIMTTKVQTLSATDTMQQAAAAMQNHNIGSLPVMGDQGMVGIVTDRDLVIRGMAAGSDPGTTSVSSLMTGPVVYGTPTMDINEAADLMSKHQIRRLPIIDGGRLVGMVSMADLARAANYRVTGSTLHDVSEPGTGH
jgi:CBS domain-containing protein